MPRTVVSRALTAALSALLVLPASALALAGGATGSGGGGGGGGGGGYSGGSYGGSSGGSGDWGATEIIIFLAVIAVFVIGPMLVPPWRRAAKRFAREKIFRRARKVEDAAHAAHAGDGYWHPDELKKRVREAFFPIQRTWEQRDVEGSRPYVSDALYERHRLQLEGLEKQGRVNRIQGLKLHDVAIVRMHNVTDDREDRFVAYIRCEARDWVEDVETGAIVNGNKTSPTEFEQYWSFVRDERYGWVLDEIQQASEGGYHLEADIVDEDEGDGVAGERTPSTA